MGMHDAFKRILITVTGSFSIVCFGRKVVIVGRNVAVVDPGLLEREFGATTITPLMHRQTGFLSTLITASGILLSLRLTIVLNVGLLRRGVSVLSMVSAAGEGSPRRNWKWTRCGILR